MVMLCLCYAICLCTFWLLEPYMICLIMAVLGSIGHTLERKNAKMCKHRTQRTTFHSLKIPTPSPRTSTTDTNHQHVKAKATTEVLAKRVEMQVSILHSETETILLTNKRCRMREVEKNNTSTVKDSSQYGDNVVPSRVSFEIITPEEQARKSLSGLPVGSESNLSQSPAEEQGDGSGFNQTGRSLFQVWV